MLNIKVLNFIKGILNDFKRRYLKLDNNYVLKASIYSLNGNVQSCLNATKNDYYSSDENIYDWLINITDRAIEYSNFENEEESEKYLNGITNEIYNEVMNYI